MTKDGNGRTVVIVGAGMAGLVSAEILAKRGFKPIVLEKADKVGGQILLASAPPHKEKIGWCTKDAETAAIKAGAEIRLNTLATPELIDSLNPYAIIVATGAVAVKPRSIKGSDGANVFTTTELLDGSVKLENKKLVIVGSGMTGLETAEMLVGQGNKLTIVEMLDEVAKGVWFQHKDDALPKLNAAGTEFILSHKLCSIDEKGITICPVKQVKNKNYKKELKEGKRALPTIAVEDGEPKHYDFDAVILSLGSRPVNDLMKALEGKCDGRVFSIGDATKIGRIADATEAAYQVASKLK